MCKHRGWSPRTSGWGALEDCDPRCYVQGGALAATNGDGQSKQEAEGVQEMRLWVCMTQEIVIVAGHTRGGRHSKQIKAGKRARAQAGR